MKRVWDHQVFFILLLWCAYAFAQSDQAAMTNADVVEMVKAGLADDTIVLAIQKRTTSFDTNPATLVSLKKQGISDKVLAAMLNSGNQQSAQPSQTQRQVFDISLGRYFCKSDTPARLTIQNGRLLVDTDKGRRHDLLLSQVTEVVIGYGGGSDDPRGCPGRSSKWAAAVTWLEGHKKREDTFNASSPSEAESLVKAIACGANVPITGLGPHGEISPDCGKPVGTNAQSGMENDEVKQEIQKIRNGPHEAMPPAQSAGASLGGQTSMTVENGTTFVLYLYILGPTGRKLQIAPGGSESLRFPPGQYEVAAKTSDPSVIPFYAIENYAPNTDYASHFYISTKP